MTRDNTIMAAIISDSATLSASLVDPVHASLPLDSTKILWWKCEKCSGEWKESVKKRTGFKYCPECSHTPTRTAKVIHTDVSSHNFMCKVCYGEYPIKSNIVICPRCDFECCKQCMITYILGGIGRAKCMNSDCGMEFTMRQMVNLFGVKWVMNKQEGGYRHHINKMFIDAERAKIPATISIIKLKQDRSKLYQKRSNIKRKINLISLKYDNFAQIIPPEVHSKLDMLRNLKSVVNYEIDDITNLIDGNKPLVKQELYIQGCPVGDCRGLINRDHICIICGGTICKKCRVPIDHTSAHSCNPDIVASIASMKGNTKACPKCGVAIFKIDGCDQMWCVECKTAFSWVTGAIETHGIHNPHYFQWLRENKRTIPRAEGDEICGGLPAQRSILNLISTNIRCGFWYAPFGRLYAIAMSNYTHVLNETRDFTNHWLDQERERYIRGTLAEDKWYAKIKISLVKLDARRVQCEILGGMQIVLREKITELYQELKASPHNKKILHRFELEFEAIRQYINKCIKEEILQQTSASTYSVDPDWNLDVEIII